MCPENGLGSKCPLLINSWDYEGVFFQLIFDRKNENLFASFYFSVKKKVNNVNKLFLRPSASPITSSMGWTRPNTKYVGPRGPILACPGCTSL